jgi:acyl-CoA synthetase (AMP-forming)/AMP-acid ligase II
MTAEPNFWGERIEAWARVQPHRAAFSSGVADLVDFEGLRNSTRALASAFARLGLDERTAVLVCLPQDTTMAVCLSSLLAAGIPAVAAAKTELAALLDRLPFRALVASEPLVESVPALASLENAERLGRNSFGAELLLVPLSRVRGEPCDFAWTLLTSGSTGEPRAVKLSARNLMERALGEIRLFRISERDRLLNILPFSHDLGLNQLLTGLAAGATLVMSRATLPMDLAEQLKTADFSGVTGMPTIWSHFLQIATRAHLKIPFEGFLTVSGGSLPGETLARLCEVFPRARIIKTYGQTETFRTLAEDRPERVCRESAGRELSGVRALVVNDSLLPCAPGEVGQLVHFGEGTMSGYWLDEEMSSRKLVAASAVPCAPPGLEHGVLTGDYFRVLPEGEYQFVGRRDDIVKRMGYRFYLTEIEAVLRRSGLLDEVCVVLLPGTTHWGAYGERLVAFIQPREVAPNLEHALRRFCRDTLAFYKVPDDFRVIERIPLTTSRKPDRKQLLASLGQLGGPA